MGCGAGGVYVFFNLEKIESVGGSDSFCSLSSMVVLSPQLICFEEEDDATRYAMMLEDQEEAEMDVVEVDGALAIRTCKLYNYKYAVITPNDIVIPPKLNDNLSKDPLA